MNFITQLKNLNKIISFLLIFIFPTKTFAEEIQLFDPIGGVSVKLDGDIYTGVLFSEEERQRYLRLEIAYNELTDKFDNLSELYKETKSAYDNLHEKTIKLNVEQLRFLDKIEKEVSEEPSFFEANKGSIFFGIGVILTSIIFISYESAK